MAHYGYVNGASIAHMVVVISALTFYSLLFVFSVGLVYHHLTWERIQLGSQMATENRTILVKYPIEPSQNGSFLFGSLVDQVNIAVFGMVPQCANIWAMLQTKGVKGEFRTPSSSPCIKPAQTSELRTSYWQPWKYSNSKYKSLISIHYKILPTSTTYKSTHLLKMALVIKGIKSTKTLSGGGLI